MPYPVIIFGAGASYDYVAENLISGRNMPTFYEYYRPPLTNDLLDPKRFEEIIRKFSDVKSLAASINAVVPHRKNLEEYLSEIKERTSKNANRQKQLIAFEFYLQNLFLEISTKYGNQSSNNYEVIKNLINDYCNEGACLVTFNYDTLLEQSFSDQITDDINSYINSPIKIIKLHGSCDWKYGLMKNLGDHKDSYNYLIENPCYFTFPNVHKTLFSQRVSGYSYSKGGETLYLCPAIAVPLPNDKKYICPESHIKELRNSLSKTDRILIIGWSAGDDYLIKIIQETTKQNILCTVILDKQESAEQVKNKISHIKNISFVLPKNQGFTNFLRSDEAEIFFTKRI